LVIILTGTTAGLFLRSFGLDAPDLRIAAILITIASYFSFKIFEEFLGTPHYIFLKPVSENLIDVLESKTLESKKIDKVKRRRK
jgi:hypothetical protein